TRAEVSPDLRTMTKKGGREADAFYRDRWSHDKVVRSTHGVNCTGSCSWKVYVKDGIITWETQQTDYPTVGPDRPEYEPRGGPRVAACAAPAGPLPLRPRRPAGDVPGGRGPHGRPRRGVAGDRLRPGEGPRLQVGARARRARARHVGRGDGDDRRRPRAHD